MENENKKEFNSKYTLSYKIYKTFSKGFLATKRSSIIVLSIVLIILILYLLEKQYESIIVFGVVFIIFILIYKIAGLNKLQYKRNKSLNNNEEVEINIKINEEKIISTSFINSFFNFSTD